MLPSQERLTRTQFTSFLSEAGIHTVYNRLGTLKYKAQTGLQLSVVTSSKHEKLAVIRNKLRRRLYSLSRQYSLQIQGVLYVSKQSYTFTYEEISALFNDLVAKIRQAAK